MARDSVQQFGRLDSDRFLYPLPIDLPLPVDIAASCDSLDRKAAVRRKFARHLGRGALFDKLGVYVLQGQRNGSHRLYSRFKYVSINVYTHFSNDEYKSHGGLRAISTRLMKL